MARAIDAIRFWLGATDYKHDELADEGGFDGIQQTFTNKEQEGRVEVQLMPFDLRFAALTTALGVQGSTRLTAPGAEGGLFDPNRTPSVAGYMFNEFKFSDTFRMQVAGRIEQAHVKGSVPDLFVDPVVAIARDRGFTPKSGAIGFLQDLPWDLVASVTAQYVERAPRAPELFSRGVHEATGTFDIGNPNLNIESAQVGRGRAAARRGPLRFEATGFYTRSRASSSATSPARPATTTRHLQPPSRRRRRIEPGDLLAARRDLPRRRIPGPARRRAAVERHVRHRRPVRHRARDLHRRQQRAAHSAACASAAACSGATPTGSRASACCTPSSRTTSRRSRDADRGYNLLKAELSYTTKLRPTDFGPRELTLGVVGNNLLNDDIRNHVSFKKDEVLLPGRGVRFSRS